MFSRKKMTQFTVQSLKKLFIILQFWQLFRIDLSKENEFTHTHDFTFVFYLTRKSQIFGVKKFSVAPK